MYPLKQLILLFLAFGSQSESSEESLDCTNDVNLRFDCLPTAKYNKTAFVNAKKLCEENGCCWNSSKINEEIPSCFYPGNYPSYKLINSTKTKSGIEAKLTRKSLAWPPAQANSVGVNVHYINENIVRVKIYDKDNSEFEPTEILEKKLPFTTNNNRNYKVDLKTDGTFGIQVKRTNNIKIFDSSISSFLYAKNYKQISSFLPSKVIYGLGEHLDNFFRGADQWRRYTFWTRGDPPSSYNQSSFNLYGHHPFFLGLDNNSEAYGVFLHNVNAMDVILQPAPAITYRTVGGVLDFFFFFGPKPEDVFQQYSSIIGKPFLPPQWALGFHLCKFNYDSTEAMKKVYTRNINAGIPLEAHWNDIDYMADNSSNFRDFTLNKHYKDLPQFVEEMHRQKRHYAINISPSLSAMEPKGTYKPFETALERGLLVKDKSGQPFIGFVWQNRSAYIDFSNPKTTKWWTEELAEFHKVLAFDALWLDMNEPYNFVWGDDLNCDKSDPLENIPYNPGGEPLNNRTLCMYAKHHAGDHFNVHSMFALYESKASFEALRKIHQNKMRPWLISRASVAGQGRWSSHWTGDIASEWSVMRSTIVAMLNFNIFGMPLNGADICGFKVNTTEELCLRWHQLGAFYTFSRNHNDNDTLEHDPAAFKSDKVARAAKESLILRYQHLPYLYSLFYRAHLFGNSVARALVFEFPSDSETLKIQEQFMWGPAILISPNLYPNQSQVRAYFPEGTWYPRNHQTIKGPKYYNLEDSLLYPNLAYRGGHIVPTQKAATTIKDQRKNPFNLIVAFDPVTGRASGEMYWDDGASFNAKYDHFVFEANLNNTSGSLVITPKVIQYGQEPPLLGEVQLLGLNKKFSPNIVSCKGHQISENALKSMVKSTDENGPLIISFLQEKVYFLDETIITWS